MSLQTKKRQAKIVNRVPNLCLAPFLGTPCPIMVQRYGIFLKKENTTTYINEEGLKAMERLPLGCLVVSSINQYSQRPYPQKMGSSVISMDKHLERA